MITTIIFIVIAYLLGSLSTGIIICKLFGLPDPRKQGSGNPGATNVLRSGGSFAGIAVLICDALKGFIPVLVARLFNIDGIALGIIALAAVLGHVFPIFFKFKGGKGVATFFGAAFALSLFMGIALVITWLIVAAIFRYSSLAAIIATILSPIYAIIFQHYGFIIPVIAIALLIIWRHQSNIKKLRVGAESKIKFKNNKKI